MLKLNQAALKARIAEMNKPSDKDPSKSDYVAPLTDCEEKEVVNFKAVMYPHSPDPTADPWPSLFVHYGVPGTPTLYCPQLNSKEDAKCAVCDYVWDNLKKLKGQGKEIMNPWRDKLPSQMVFVAGIIRGREKEGPKFLKIKSYRDQMSKKHDLLFTWSLKESTQNWMDPKEGYDIELTYVKNDNKMFRAKTMLDTMELGRDKLPFPQAAGTYENFLKTVKKVTDLIPVATYEDTLKALEGWMAFLEKQAKKANINSTGTVVGVKNEAPEQEINVDAVDVSDTAKIQAQLTKLGL